MVAPLLLGAHLQSWFVLTVHDEDAVAAEQGAARRASSARPNAASTWSSAGRPRSHRCASSRTRAPASGGSALQRTAQAARERWRVAR